MTAQNTDGNGPSNNRDAHRQAAVSAQIEKEVVFFFFFNHTQREGGHVVPRTNDTRAHGDIGAAGRTKPPCTYK